jgi:hypothetical protein
MTSVNITTGELLAHVRDLEAKARAYDELLGELTAVADHLDATSESYYRSVGSTDRLDAPTMADALRREWTLGKGQAYAVSAASIRNAIDGIK